MFNLTKQKQLRLLSDHSALTNHIIDKSQAIKSN